MKSSVVVDDGLSLRMQGQLEDASRLPFNPVPRSGLQLEFSFFTGNWRRADAMSVFCLNAKHELRSALKDFTPCFSQTGGCPHFNARASHCQYPVHASKHLQGIWLIEHIIVALFTGCA
jgi:hypothetical protein